MTNARRRSERTQSMNAGKGDSNEQAEAGMPEKTPTPPMGEGVQGVGHAVGQGDESSTGEGPDTHDTEDSI